MHLILLRSFPRIYSIYPLLFPTTISYCASLIAYLHIFLLNSQPSPSVSISILLSFIPPPFHPHHTSRFSPKPTTCIFAPLSSSRSNSSSITKAHHSLIDIVRLLVPFFHRESSLMRRSTYSQYIVLLCPLSSGLV